MIAFLVRFMIYEYMGVSKNIGTPKTPPSHDQF